MAQETLVAQAPYALGHSPEELNRLDRQARFFGDLTTQVLQLAGIAAGMRVLDVGCGTGGTSYLAAQLVGPEGLVIGVDRAPEAIAQAKVRAAATRLTNVHFVTQDLAAFSPTFAVDALIGSRILMYLSDPAVQLRRLAEFVRPGGIVAFQEFDLDGAKSEPFSPLYEHSLDRIRRTFARAGVDNRAGLKLAQIFEEAGLPSPQMLQGSRVEKGPESELFHQVAHVSRALLPLMERLGVAKAAEMNVESLAARLSEEAVILDATYVAPPMIGAWAHKG